MEDAPRQLADPPTTHNLSGELEMGLPQPKSLFTVDEYLAFERKADERHYYLDGEIFAMAGENDAHGIITVNVVVTLGSQLKGSPCQARTKDTKVRSGPIPESGRLSRGLFTYPDILVVCGEPEYHDAFTDVILNPAAILEVLSPSTEAFDRGEKFNRLQTWNPTLRDFLLVSQDQARIEHYSRQADGSWSYQRHVGLETEFAISSIRCTLKVADVYDRIKFPKED
jgi:Uma2 family endonuclease